MKTQTIRTFALSTLPAMALALDMIGGAETMALGEQAELRATLSCSKDNVQTCDPVGLELVIENLSDRETAILSPEFPARTVVPVFRDVVNDKSFGLHVKWKTALISDQIKLAPNGSYKAIFQLEKLYPLGMPPGSYELGFRYTPDYRNWVDTNRIKLEVAPVSEAVEKEHEAALRVLRSAEREDVVRAAYRFLEEYPRSRFSHLVELELANNLLALKRYTKTERTLQEILDSPRATTHERRQANWVMAQSLRARGEVQAALGCLSRMGTRQAARVAQKWSVSVSPKPD